MDNENKSNVGNGGQSGFMAFLSSRAGRLALTAVFAVIIYGLLFAVVAIDNEYVVLAIIVICGYFGWKSLTRIQPSMFLWMSIAGWVVYFFIKASLSAFIGVFIAPFAIGKKLSDMVASARKED